MSIEPFDFISRTKIVYGIGRIGEIARHAQALAGRKARIVVISDPGVEKVGLVDRVLSPLKEAGFETYTFNRVISDPTSACVDQAAQMIRRTYPGCVVAIGGGSALDVAKLTACTASSESPSDKYGLCTLPLPERTVAIVAIPTTAGTGAEVTRTAIISDRHGRKIWFWAEQMAPDLAIIDPTLTATLPADLTTATAFDALVHAIEACTHQRSNPIAKALSLSAVDLIAGSLTHVLQQPDDLSARANLSIAATLSGMAIDASGCGIAHAMGHALSSIGGIHHGRSVALVLKAAYVWNIEGAVPVYAQIARALGVPDKGRGDASLALKGSDKFRQLMQDCGLKISLAEDGLTTGDIPRLVEETLSPANWVMCESNCRIPSKSDLAKIAAEVLS